MNQFRRMRMFAGFGLALACALTWQQTSGARAETRMASPLSAPMHLIKPFRQPNSDYSAGHRGVDYAVAFGQTIFAPTDTSVTFSQVVVNRSVLTLSNPNGDIYEFEPACGNLPLGTQVSAGQAIGYVCAPEPSYLSHCKTLCLHFSLRTAKGYLSPLVRYGALAPSVLLPFL